jgi:hypothetical protein
MYVAMTPAKFGSDKTVTLEFSAALRLGIRMRIGGEGS